jgi:hypothetical protein
VWHVDDGLARRRSSRLASCDELAPDVSGIAFKDDGVGLILIGTSRR